MSPDHQKKPTERLMVLQPGDSLEDLCQQIYGDGSLAQLVAEYNGLEHYQNLPGGTQLIFPPMPQA